jgi:hypothetical protein
MPFTRPTNRLKFDPEYTDNRSMLKDALIQNVIDRADELERIQIKMDHYDWAKRLDSERSRQMLNLILDMSRLICLLASDENQTGSQSPSRQSVCV